VEPSQGSNESEAQTRREKDPKPQILAFEAEALTSVKHVSDSKGRSKGGQGGN